MITRRTLLSTASTLAGAAVLPAATQEASRDAAPGANPKASTAPTPAGASPTLLVLGGTGFLGPAMVEVALARGIRVTLFNRGKTNADLFPELEKLYGDRDPKVGDGLKALEGDRKWDFVVDTSSYFPRLTQAVCELLKGRIRRYAFISTVSVYPDLSLIGLDETAETATLEDPSTEDLDNGSYGGLKVLCEKAAEAALPGQVLFLRPGLIVGPRDSTDRFSYWPVRIDAGGEVLVPGDGQDPVQWIDVRDLAEFTIDSLLAERTGTYNMVGPSYGATMADLAHGCRAVSTSGARFTYVPAERCAELGLNPWGELPVWSPRGTDLAGINVVSAAKAIAGGFKSRSLADTAAATLAYWNTLPEARRARLRAGMSREAEQKALAAFRSASGSTPAPATEPSPSDSNR
jgi:2'-hydroxyisoflavone reductase